MRILIVNTSENAGGAAVAANRLMHALNQTGERAKMLVRDKRTDNASVVSLGSQWLQRWRFLWERLVIYVCCLFSRKHIFEIDIACAGADITKLKEFKEADIIHLHWVNQGMLSLKGIRKILECGKPVVWTMHDIWAATSVCHLTLGCNKFKTGCENCKYLPPVFGADIAKLTWKAKRKMLKGHNVHFVACSKWLAGEARKSALLAGQKVSSIPNPIDTTTFCKASADEARSRIGLPKGKRIVLFASQRATSRNKGMEYLLEACQKLANRYPEMRENTCVAILGSHADEVVANLPFAAYPLGYTSETSRIVDVYNACDVFVLPSLSENLPNTIMEAMACGVPCIGFNVGGIPEMIDHMKNGYVTRYRDSDDLAEGMHWLLFESDYSALSDNAQQKVFQNYSPNIVAMKYVELYSHAVAEKRYKL